MRAIGYSIGMFVGVGTLIITMSVDMPVWAMILSLAINGISGALVVGLIERFKERWDDRESV